MSLQTADIASAIASGALRVIDLTHTLSPVEHVYEWGGIRLIPFVCEMAAGSAEPFAHEHSALEWAAFEAFARYEFAPADVPVIELLKSIA